ncbi:MAG: winged helix DNA-binding domain-containing protein, partial [Chloroflexota bacterium]
MALTLRQLNRATLDRQLLLRREPIAVDEAVGRIAAIQAQEPASPYVALWNRIAGFVPADLDRAFADGSIMKSTLMRVTLHAVTAADHPILHRAT